MCHAIGINRVDHAYAFMVMGGHWRVTAAAIMGSPRRVTAAAMMGGHRHDRGCNYGRPVCDGYGGCSTR